jgi:hypothetical protein
MPVLFPAHFYLVLYVWKTRTGQLELEEANPGVFTCQAEGNTETRSYL